MQQVQAQAGEEAPHHCHVPNCPRRVDPRYLMCPGHWGLVPKGLQDLVWRAYRPGQEVDKRPSADYLEAAKRAIAAAVQQETSLGVPTLSVRQPWAWAIFHADKNIENRAFPDFRYRGPLLVHISNTCTRLEYERGVESIGMMREDLGLPAMDVPPLSELARGGLYGIVRVVGAQRNGDYEEGFIGWRIACELGIELESPRVLPFHAYKGQRGVFRVQLGQLPRAYTDAFLEMRGNGG